MSWVRGERGPGGPLSGSEGSTELAFEVAEDPFEVGFIQDLFVLGGAQ